MSVITVYHTDPWNLGKYSQIHTFLGVFVSVKHAEVSPVSINSVWNFSLTSNFLFWLADLADLEMILKPGSALHVDWGVQRASCVSTAPITETLFFQPYKWALMTKHRTRPPVGSEMEISEDTNAIKRYMSATWNW